MSKNIHFVEAFQNAKKVHKIYHQIVMQGYLEDRREYDVELLMEMYKLSEEDASELEELIQSDFRPSK